MEFFSYKIVKVLEENTMNRTVSVRLIRNFYDGDKEETVGFFKSEWEAYKAQGAYPEKRMLDNNALRYYESMTEEEWCNSRYNASIKDFSDEELVAEFNRRLANGLFSRVTIEAHAALRKD